MAKLASPSSRARESALIALTEHPIENVIEPVANLLIDDSSHVAQATCLDLLERLGAAVSLAEVRADGWLQQIGARIQHFERIREIMGARFLAYSIILGIQIRAIAVDPKFKANTSIEFAIDNDKVQTLPLIEFQTQVVQSLLKSRRGSLNFELPLTVDQAASIVGGHSLLLAPLFDISIEHLVLANEDKVNPSFIIGYISGGGFNFVHLKKFEELIKGKVRRDLAGLAEEPFKLDLLAVDRAKEASKREDFDRVIEILESWPGLLSILNRTPLAKNLANEKLEKIGEGLELLGSAFERRGRPEWSEELYKLGLQFIKEGGVAAKLFGRLGILLVESHRYAEAIGLLRRAIQLNVKQHEINVALGLAFLRTGKSIAARAILEQEAASGANSPKLDLALQEVRGILESYGVSWDIPLPTQSG